MEKPEQGVIDFLTEQLKRREDERVRVEEQIADSLRSNLRNLVTTWRFIIVTRGAFLVLGFTGLQFVLKNRESFLETGKLIPVFEQFINQYGNEVLSALIKQMRMLTSEQATDLVGFLIVCIMVVAVTMDMLLGFLQKRCRKRGEFTERKLQIEGLFSEMSSLRTWIALPFIIAPEI